MPSDFIISSTSSIIACLITYPIDVIKTRYQINQVSNNKQTINNIIRNIKPYTSYYKGVSYNLMTYPIFWGTYFQIDSSLSNKIPTTGYYYFDKTTHALGGSYIASIITNPLYVLKTRYQTENNNNTIRKIFYNEGIQGLFKGLNATLINNTKLGIQFPLYDYMRNKDISVLWASFWSKFITSTIFYPFDLVRSKQRDSVTSFGLIHGFKVVFKNNGILGLYKGVSLYTLTTLPNFVLMMCFREYFKK